MSTKDSDKKKLDQVADEFSLVLNDSGADVFKSSRYIVKELRLDESHTLDFIACIYHDKDYNEVNDLKTPHYHLCLKFQDRFRVRSILNYIVDKFHCNENQVQIQKCTDFGAQVRYLVHLDNKDKYPYPKEDVVCSDEKTLDYYFSHLRVLDERDLVRIVEMFPNKRDLFLKLGFKQYSKYLRIINDLLRY